MLKHLTIQNYALISHLDIDFHTGFSVVTGETGAGKSIILGALGLLLGQRADAKSITDGEQKCIIEAEFDITQNPAIQALFVAEDWDYAPNCTIRREITTNGKSRAFVNDTPVLLNSLSQLGQLLVDIHSQHENLLLRDDMFCLGLVDGVAKNASIARKYAETYNSFTTTKNALYEACKLAERTKKDADYITFQFNQLDEAHLQAGELELLEEKETLLTHAEDIQLAYQEALTALSERDTLPAVNSVKEALTALRSISKHLKDNDLEQRLESVLIELKDIAATIEEEAEAVEVNPQELARVQERLDLLQTLLKKHQLHTVEELIALRDELGSQINNAEQNEEEISRLQHQLEQDRKALLQAAKALTDSRLAIIPTIEKQLVQDLAALGIKHAKVQLQTTLLDEPQEHGQDYIQLLFAANLNQQLQPVAQVASGGEIARLMLSIKTLLADTQGLPTIIFDEIDTGVSGEIANRMGEIMRRMGASRQVISLTHLPQIAAKGEHHYKVYKQDAEQRTESHICLLNPEERVQEIALMLSGENISTAAIENAQCLIESSKKE